MYVANKGSLNTQELIKFLNQFRLSDLPRFQRLKKYYNTEHDILRRIMADVSKPNNKIVNPFPQYIADLHTGYFMGEPVSYKTRDTENKELDEVKMVLDYNNEQDENVQLAQDCSIYGKAYEIVYIHDKSLRFKALPPTETFIIVDDTVEHETTYAVRVYEYSNGYKIELYDSKEVLVYTAANLFDTLTLVDQYVHGFSAVPIVSYSNNSNEDGDFESIIPLVDAYDILTSDALNDQEAFTDAYLVFTGVEVDADDIVVMKENRVITVPEGADVEWLVKNANDTQSQNDKNRLENDIHKFSKTPNVSDEAFASNASGIAMQYKLMGTENKASIKERKFKKGLQGRLSLLLEYLNIVNDVQLDWRAIEINFTRNLPTDETQLVALINSLRGLVSDETLISWLPQIEDPSAEIQKKLGETSKVVDYNFEE